MLKWLGMRHWRRSRASIVPKPNEIGAHSRDSAVHFTRRCSTPGVTSFLVLEYIAYLVVTPLYDKANVPQFLIQRRMKRDAFHEKVSRAISFRPNRRNCYRRRDSKTTTLFHVRS